MSVRSVSASANQASTSLASAVEVGDNLCAVIQSVSNRIFEEMKEVLEITRADAKTLALLNRARCYSSTSTPLKKEDRTLVSLMKILGDRCDKEELQALNELMSMDPGYKLLTLPQILCHRISHGFEGLHRIIGDDMILKLKEGAAENIFKLQGYSHAKIIATEEISKDSSKASFYLDILRQKHTLYSPKTVIERLEITLKTLPLIYSSPQAAKARRSHQLKAVIKDLEGNLQLFIKVLNHPDSFEQVMEKLAASYVGFEGSELYSLSQLRPLLDLLKEMSGFINKYSTFSLVDVIGFSMRLQKLVDDLDKLGARRAKEEKVMEILSEVVSHICRFTSELYPLYQQILASLSPTRGCSVEESATHFLYEGFFSHIFSTSALVLDHLSNRFHLFHDELLFQSNLMLAALTYSSAISLEDFPLVPGVIVQELSKLTELQLCPMTLSDARDALYFHLTALFPDVPKDKIDILLSCIHSPSARKHFLEISSMHQANQTAMRGYAETHYHRLMSYKAMKELQPLFQQYDPVVLARLSQAKANIEAYLETVTEELKTTQLQNQIRQMSYNALHKVVLTCTLQANLDRVFSAEEPDLEEIFPEEVLDLIAFFIPGLDDQVEPTEILSIAADDQHHRCSAEEMTMAQLQPSPPKIKKKRVKSRSADATAAVAAEKDPEPVHVSTSQIDVKALRKYRKIKAFVEMLGFSITRQTGSHQIFEDEEGRQLVIPRHGRDLKKGTLHSIVQKVL